MVPEPGRVFVRVVVVALGMTVLSGPAHAATTFTVSQAGENGNGNTAGCPASAPCSLDNAIAQANAAGGTDVIQVSGPLSVNRSGATNVSLDGSAIDLRGSGRDAGGTSFAFGTGNIRIGAGSTVSDVSVAAGGSGVLVYGGATLRRSRIATTTNTAQAINAGVSCPGNTTATVDDVVVTASPTSTASVVVASPACQVELSEMDITSRHRALETSQATVNVSRSTIRGAIMAGSVLTLSDTVFPPSPSNFPTVITVISGATRLFHVTMDGTGFSQTGASIGVAGAILEVHGSIIRGYPTASITRTNGTCTVETSDIQSSTCTAGAGNLDVDPQFVNRAGGDYRLTPASPLIDAAGTPSFFPGESLTDRVGRSRSLDGNNDGVVARDMGAYEYEYQPPAVPDRTAPTLTASLSTKAFAVGKAPTAKSAAKKRKKSTKPTSTRIRYSTSEAATVRFAIQRKTTGRKSGKKCVAYKRKLRKKRKCTRYVAAGTLTRKREAAGSAVLTFTGRVGRKALARGRYRLTIAATDAAGNRSKAKVLTFSIVKP